MGSLLFLSLAIYGGFIIYIIIGLFRYIDNDWDEIPHKSVSIVIAARNEENNLESLLNDIALQDYPLDLLEVSIVDDRSTDKTWEIITQFSEKYSFIRGIQIHELSEEMTPKKNALTKAIEMTSGDIIVTTDADCRVPTTWVSSMVKSLGDNYSISIGYSQTLVSANSLFHRFQNMDFLGIMVANAGAAGWNNYWSGSGQNLAYLRSAFEEIGGFKPVHYRISGDDMYLVQSISKIGKATFNIDLGGSVKTTPTETVEQFVNQRSRWASNSRRMSEGSYSFFLFLVAAFLSNVFIFISFFFGIGPFISAFLIKFIFEGSVLFFGGQLFKTPTPFYVYILWAFIQPFYIPAIALMGLNDKFKWKP